VEKPRTGILSGWKSIANYLDKGVRTVQRYEREMGLPVRRPSGRSFGSVIATKADLNSWVAASPTRRVSQRESILPSTAVLNEFRRNILEMARLREESAESRQALAASRNALKRTLGSIRVVQRELHH
jgi:cytidylate kinase